jgi:hypothetical protein
MAQQKVLTPIVVSFALTVLLGLLDYVTGYELGFFVFYFIPISYAAWISGRRSGIVVSVICTLTWFLVDAISSHPYSFYWYGMWNAGIRLVSFLVITLAISRVKELLISEKELSAQLQETLDQVKELRGLLYYLSVRRARRSGMIKVIGSKLRHMSSGTQKPNSLTVSAPSVPSDSIRGFSTAK